MTEKRRPPSIPSSADLPWSVPVVVAQIPEAGSHLTFEADGAQRAGLAQLAGLRDVMQVKASFDLTHIAGGTIHATGRVTARIGQSCVVTLEPIENSIDEEIDVMFVPPSHNLAAAGPSAKADDDENLPDPPELIVSGVIDLGKLAMDMLFLGIDPYPRKPGVQFVPAPVENDPDENPFAALKALKDGPLSVGKKPKSH